MFSKSALVLFVLFACLSYLSFPVYSEETPTPLPSATPTAVPSATPTPTVSPTPSPSVTASPTPSQSASASPSPVSSVTPKPTVKVTATKKPATPSPSATASPSSMPVAEVVSQPTSAPAVKAYTASTQSVSGPGIVGTIAVFLAITGLLGGGIFILRKNPKLR